MDRVDMAITSHHPRLRAGDPAKSTAARVFAWSGVAIMWLFWICFVIFLAQPAALSRWWPLPTIDRGGWLDHTAARVAIDIGLVALFGLQHSLMARPWIKARLAKWVREPFERCLYVHMANLSLFALILLWQPLPSMMWSLPAGWPRDVTWLLFAAGWLILFAGAWSFGILELLGVRQMERWLAGRAAPEPALKTGLVYRYLRHPMYVGVLMGVWITPDMSVGHLLLAASLTIYVSIGMRYEERDLARRFGASYRRWRAVTT